MSKCDICGKEYENLGTDLLIQLNIKTGKMVCMDCAFIEWEKLKATKD
jgi:hypothetical protein